MLVLSRRIGEEVVVRVGDVEVQVFVLALSGASVRLGIGAPRDEVTIHRREVLERMAEEMDRPPPEKQT